MNELHVMLSFRSLHMYMKKLQQAPRKIPLRALAPVVDQPIQPCILRVRRLIQTYHELLLGKVMEMHKFQLGQWQCYQVKGHAKDIRCNKLTCRQVKIITEQDFSMISLAHKSIFKSIFR